MHTDVTVLTLSSTPSAIAQNYLQAGVSQLGSQVSFLQRRLADFTDATANIVAQLCELNELRDRFRAAQLSARRSRRIDIKKRPRF
jgi:hypothetical protein